jgi:hypothetical protein
VNIGQEEREVWVENPEELPEAVPEVVPEPEAVPA